ncbi:MAG: T9SS type A sorting domain-containing protein [Bacteroidota bacterium]
MRISKQPLVLLALCMPLLMHAQHNKMQSAVTFSCSGFKKSTLPTQSQYVAAVSDRFGNHYAAEELEYSKNLTHCSEKSHFLLDFIGPFTEAERNTICQTFSDLSDQFETHTTNILIRVVKEPLPQGVFGAGTSYYLEDTNGQGCGIGHNMVWELMNTAVSYEGVLPYNAAAGVLKINTQLPQNLYWHTLADDSTQGLSTYSVDLYTVTLHEALHMLGFASRMQSDGSPFQGFYAKWDQLLHAEIGPVPLENVVDNYLLRENHATTCCNALSVNPNIFGLVAGIGNCHTGQHGIAIKAGNDSEVTVFAPMGNYGNQNQALRNRLSHLNSECDGVDYVMHYSLSSGDRRRTISEPEFDLLCQLGYTRVNQDDACENCNVIAINDLFIAQGLYTTIATSAIVGNDALPADFDATTDFQIDFYHADAPNLEILPFGNSWLIKGLFPGQRYAIEYTISGCEDSCDKGTFFIERPPSYEVLSNCASDPCGGENLFCYGDFEAFQPDLHYSYHSQLELENCHLFNPGSINSPDILAEANGNQYAQIVNAGNNIELLTIPLQVPIPPGCDLVLDFDYRRYNNGQDGELYLFATADSPCATDGQPLPSNTPADAFIPLLEESMTVTNFDWQTSSLQWTNTTGQAIAFISFVNQLGQPQTSKLHIDNVAASLACDNELSLNATVVKSCWNEEAVIEYEICLDGGNETPVDIILESEGPNFPGWSLADTAFTAGLTTLNAVQPGTGCRTVAMKIALDAILSEGTALQFSLTATAQNSCQTSTSVTTELLIEACEEDFACACTGGVTIDAGAWMNLSSLSDLPPALNNTCIAISGHLIVDRDWQITGGQLLMQPGSKITVQAGVKLSLDEINSSGGITSCDRRWEGITVETGGTLILQNSTIQHAERAIFAKDKTILSVGNNHFINNKVGIYSAEAALPQLILLTSPLEGNTFESTGPLLPAADYSGAEEWAEAALVLHHSVVHSGSWEETTPNIARGLKNGIIAHDSKFTIQGFEFQNLMGNGVTTPFLNDLQGIGVYAKHSDIEIIGSNFTALDRGVHVESSNVYLSENVFSKVLLGTVLLEQNDQTAQIEHNQFLFAKYGIYLYKSNSPEALLITDNQFESTYSADMLTSRAIYALGDSGIGSGLKLIESNELSLNNRTNGISILNDGGFEINHNYISFDSLHLQGSGSPCGISLGLSNGNIIFGNSIDAVDRTDRVRGIFVTTSTDNSFCCNTTDATKTGFEFFGNCSGTQLRNNQIGSHQVGLKCGYNTTIGEQLIGGNQWQGAYEVAAAQHLGNVMQIASSSFYIGATADDGTDSYWPSSIDTPTPQTPWFIQSDGHHLSCEEAAFSCGSSMTQQLVNNSTNQITPTFYADLGTNNSQLSTEAVDVEAVRAIAQQCPSADGPAIYKAIALLQSAEPSDWEVHHWCVSPTVEPLSLQENAASVAQLWPNPTHGNVQLQVAGQVPQLASWALLNPFGEMVKTVVLNNATRTLQLDLGELPAGIYFWVIRTPNKVIDSGKLLLQR